MMLQTEHETNTSDKPPGKFEHPIYVTKPHLPPLEEYVRKLEVIWNNRQLTNSGPLLREFEFEAAKYLKTPFALAYVNGHCALEAAIRALDLTGEIITTPFTFPSTIHAITLNKLEAVFCDIDPQSYNIDHQKIEKLITKNTSAILAVHVFGRPCNVSALQAIADKHNLKLIYDAAHAFGVEIDHQGIGQFGDVSVFSLHATKVFNSVEGALITFKDKKYQRIFSMLRNFGYTDESEEVELIGSNMKMSEFHAAMGLINLQSIDSLIEKRKRIYQIYLDNINRLPGLRLLDLPNNVSESYSYCAIEIDENLSGLSREIVHDYLCAHNVFPRKYFHPLCTDLACYKDQKFYKQDFEHARTVSKSVLCLPIYSDLEPKIVTAICQIIESLF